LRIEFINELTDNIIVLK